MKITRRSPFTGLYTEMDLPITEEQMRRFEAPDRSELVQDIFPDLTPAQREFVMSGYTDSDWKALFGPDED